MENSSKDDKWIVAIARPLSIALLLIVSASLFRYGSYISFAISISLIALTAYRKSVMPSYIKNYYRLWYMVLLIVLIVCIPIQFS